MNCPNCGAPNPEGSRFCGRCGSGLEAPPPAFPVSGLSGETLRQAGGVAGVLAALLAAVGLGMAADYVRNRVAPRVLNCGCTCLVVAGIILCMFVFGLVQSIYGR